MIQQQIEQFLQEEQVYSNEATGHLCPMDAPSTVLNFSKLAGAIRKNKFTLEQWNEACKHWGTKEHVSPTIFLTRMIVQGSLAD